MSIVLPLILAVLTGCNASITGEISEKKIDSITSSERRIFVTADTYDGNLGGRSGANSKCQTSAESAGLKLSYIAVLSTAGPCASNGAKWLIDDQKPVFSISASGERTQVAASYSALWSSTLSSPILYDQYGNSITLRAWTGSIASGCPSGANCASWTNTTEMGGGMRGDPTTTSSAWVQDVVDACSGFNPLYCVSK